MYNQKEKHETLAAFIPKLLDAGFRVMIPVEFKEKNQIYISLWDPALAQMLYIQANYFSGWNYSTTNKPTMKYGTGQQIKAEEMELSVDMVNRCLVAAERINGYYSERGLVLKEQNRLYTSVQDFLTFDNWHKEHWKEIKKEDL